MDIFSIFSLLYIVYVIRAVQLLIQIAREWTSLKEDPLSKHKKSLVGQAAFFLAVPPSVIVHEFFHALAIWYFGGRVVDYGFTFYGGYVVPDRLFMPAEQWLISIAGTVGSLVFGFSLWLALRHHSSRTFRYFALRSLHMQLILSLIFYPLLAVGGFGDWATIYDFSVTPLLSGVTAVLHITSLILFYRADRHGWFEMAGFETVTEQAQFDESEKQLALQPQNRELEIQVMRGWIRGGAQHKAIYTLKQYLQKYPNDAANYAMLAALEVKQHHVPAKAKDNAEKALKMGVNHPESLRLAHQVLGEYFLERDQYQTAITHFSDALTAVKNDSAQLSYLYSRRSLAYRRQGQYDHAYQDIEQAVQLAQQSGNQKQTAVYQQELDIIQQQAGRPLGSSTNPPADQDVV